jgi:flavin reductase (DIM6/NTAB) family NADH-FMN oxidoreductase RutF
MLNPVPAVMVSCAGKNKKTASGRPNIITIAWAGTICSEPPMLSISIRKSRHSYAQITETAEFVVNLVGKSLLEACDYCGVRSGADEDKFKSCKLTAVPAPKMKYAPAVKEACISISCAVRSVHELGSHDLFIAEILAVSVDNQLIDSKGKICLEKMEPICYLHGDYYSLGKMMGFFGYSVASDKAYTRRMGKRKPVQ